jgi:ABC-type polysaccharide/polyol phosphate transport system ATPase subunit
VSGAGRAIEVRGLSKSFRIPREGRRSLADRVRDVRRTGGDRLEVLRDISIDVDRGEFVGVVGRNGSGKSTLLKLIASIYRADAGSIRVAGRIAPFIELGVGFNPQLTARDNVVLNGVMMGLSTREARRRFDEVIDFAELAEFRGLPLKNYSSGMQVRLAFAMMVQVDADVLLFDEVLAVGDAGFQKRSREKMIELRDSGRTVVLVTHSLHSLQLLCSRAFMIEDGRIAADGDPDDIAGLYGRLAFEQGREEPQSGEMAIRDAGRIDRLDIEGGPLCAQPTPIRFSFEAVARQRIETPHFGMELLNTNGVRLFNPLPAPLRVSGDQLEPGERVRGSGWIENRLAPGRYLLRCAVFTLREDGGMVAQTEPRTVELQVEATGWRSDGLVSLEHEVQVAGRVEVR